MSQPAARLLTPVQVERRYLLLSALQWLPVGLVIPVMVLLMRARGLELPVVGLLFALYSAVVIVLELPTGSLADVLGRRATLILSRLLFVVGIVVFAVAAEPLAFAAAIVVSATARALQSGPLEAWYVDTVRASEPEADIRRGISRGWAVEASAIAIGAVGGGFMPGLLAGLALNGLVVPLSVPFLLAAGLTLASLAAVIAFMSEPVRRTVRPSAGALLRDVPPTIAAGLQLAGRDRTIRLVLAAGMTFGFILAALEVLSPVHFAALLGGEERGSGAYGVLVAMAFIGNAGGSAIAPRAAAVVRSGPRATALFSGLIALALAGMALGNSFAIVALLYVAVYLFAGVAGPLKSETLHRRVEADRRATLLSVASLTQQLGGLVGALVVPTLAAAGFAGGWLLAAAAALVGAGLLALLPATIPRISARPGAYSGQQGSFVAAKR